MFIRIPIASLLLSLIPVFASAVPPSVLLPPKMEVRAVWVTTAAGLDWPRVTGKTQQQESLRRLIHQLHRAHFNTIYFQVRPRGDAMYKSRYEPWAELLTGKIGTDPGWDPCAFVLEEAHALGMEVHGWFNVFKIRGPNPVGHSTPEHPSHAFAQWCAERDEELWLDPGRPEIRNYLVNVALDLVSRYDLDGINFDFIRYPGHDFPDEESYARYGNGMRRDDWRRGNVTAFVRAFAEQIGRIKPHLKIGSSPFGVWRSDANNDRRGGYYWVYQDSYGWLKNKWHDYLCPQAYWNIGRTNGEPDFAQVAREWNTLTAGRHIYVGIGAYRPGVKANLGAYIDSCRTSGNVGHTFFRWTDVADPSVIAGRYQTQALIPPMRWKDSIPPLEPREPYVVPAGPRLWTLRWGASGRASDGDTAYRYVVYRWTSRFIPFSNPSAIAAVVPASQRYFSDSLQNGTQGEFFYAVAACDRTQNESAPSAVVSSNATPALQAPLPLPRPTAPNPNSSHPAGSGSSPSPGVSLRVSVAESTGRPVAALYTIGKRSRVALDVFVKRAGASDSLHAQLVRAVQSEGKYKVSLKESHFDPGTYLMRLTTTDGAVEQMVHVRE